MKTFLKILFILCLFFTADAQQSVLHDELAGRESNPSALRTIVPAAVIQNHAYAPEMILYDWDTLSNTWIYHYTVYMYYNSDSQMVSSVSYDTVANVPLQHDTTVTDSLGRILENQIQIWNAGWQNSFRLEHTFWDTNYFNRTTRHYSGSGAIWTLNYADSSYGYADVNGNLIENYYESFDIPAGIFKPNGKTLTEYDVLNRVQKRRNYNYDTTTMQYVIRSLDSNIVYDNVYTNQITDQINYTYGTGVQTPYLRTEMLFNGVSIMDNIQTQKQYNLQLQAWDDYHRWTTTGQACENLDSTITEAWSVGSGWEPIGGTRFVMNWIDSCDYNEIAIQYYITYLGTFRNAFKWVYPYPSTLGIEQQDATQNKITIVPNPFHETASLNLEFNPNSYRDHKASLINIGIKIYNVMGELVRSEEISSINSFVLQRAGLNDGLYFYELRTNNYKLIGTGKFVIQ
ncbi:hypothetical protein BH11BAC1_BH11BAC1_19310 [soil metagenome]